MSELTKKEFFVKLASLRMANLAGGGRSPYKPLLLLWALGQIRAGARNEFSYAVAEEPICQLIDEFSQSSTTRYRARLPFFHLEEDLWVLSGDGELGPRRSVLRQNNAVGRFHDDVMKLLKSEPGLIEESARLLIEMHFTESYLEPIFAAIGLDLVGSIASGIVLELDTRRRDPKFRNSVLIAWRKQCAMCGYDGELMNASVGLEAAHVKWFSQGGPDELENGMALCEIHHALFDLGVLGISRQHRIMVSSEFIGKSDASKRLVYDLHDQELRDPAPNRPLPSVDFLVWHKEQVFRDKLSA